MLLLSLCSTLLIGLPHSLLGPQCSRPFFKDKPHLHWSWRKQGKPDWYFGLRFQSYACAESTGPWCLLVLIICVLFSFVFPFAFGLKSGLLKVEKMPKIPGARLVKDCCQECRHLKQGKEGLGAKVWYCDLGEFAKVEPFCTQGDRSYVEKALCITKLCLSHEFLKGDAWWACL